jgi:hypothetical protein
MRPAATAPAGSVHSEIAIAAAPARQTQPCIANPFDPDIRAAPQQSTANLNIVTVVEQSPLIHQASPLVDRFKRKASRHV